MATRSACASDAVAAAIAGRQLVGAVVRPTVTCGKCTEPACYGIGDVVQVGTGLDLIIVNKPLVLGLAN